MKDTRHRARHHIDGTEGIDFVRCRICGDRRRVISGRHLSKHGTGRETYMEEYCLSPDELIAKDFRQIQSSRPGYQPYGKNEWIRAIKKIHGNGGSIFAGDLQRTHPYVYNQGLWIFGDWDAGLSAAGFNPEAMRKRRFREGQGIIKQIFAAEQLRCMKRLVNVAYEMKEPGKGNGLALRVSGIAEHAFVLGHRG